MEDLSTNGPLDTIRELPQRCALQLPGADCLGLAGSAYHTVGWINVCQLFEDFT